MTPEPTSKTPETDAFENERHTMNAYRKVLEHARSLELRLAEAKADVEKYKEAMHEAQFGKYGSVILTQQLTTLQQENAALREDKARLDWLEKAHHRPEWLMNLSQDARMEIDKAMKDYHSTLTKEQK